MHRNARLTVWARQEIVRRRQAGWTLAEIARQLNVSRATASKWWHRFLADPDGDWFEDRSSRPHSCPHQTPAELEAAILRLRHQEKLGPARIGYRLDMPASTVWKGLRRHRINRLVWMDRPTGRVVLKAGFLLTVPVNPPPLATTPHKITRLARPPEANARAGRLLASPAHIGTYALPRLGDGPTHIAGYG